MRLIKARLLRQAAMVARSLFHSKFKLDKRDKGCNRPKGNFKLAAICGWRISRCRAVEKYVVKLKFLYKRALCVEDSNLQKLTSWKNCNLLSLVFVDFDFLCFVHAFFNLEVVHPKFSYVLVHKLISTHQLVHVHDEIHCRNLHSL